MPDASRPPQLGPFDRFSPGVAVPAPPPGPEKSKRRRRLAYATIAGLAVATAAATALLLGVSKGVAAQLPMRIVREQLTDIGEGRIDTAYSRLSEGWRQRMTREEFANLVKAHPALARNAHHTFPERATQEDAARLSGTLVSDEGERESVTIELVRERGAWVIAAIRF
jgi:hypothetical protein